MIPTFGGSILRQLGTWPLLSLTAGLRSILILAVCPAWNGLCRADESGAATVIPTTPAGIWAAIDKESDEITKAIAVGRLQVLHHHAFAIRDLVAALPERSPTLPAADLPKVKADVKFVATLAERLDAAGDSNDKTESVSNFNKLKAILSSLHALYRKSIN